jgi:hypothetical protein
MTDQIPVGRQPSDIVEILDIEWLLLVISLMQGDIITYYKDWYKL